MGRDSEEIRNGGNGNSLEKKSRIFLVYGIVHISKTLRSRL
jgi:hypothetical protein